MVNSHYIPQFILRNFCNDERIQYYDMVEKTVEKRTTKTVFSERGYYPDKLEKDLCYKIESQFANVLNKKIINEKYRITIDQRDQMVIKKFLIITMLRVRDENLDHNIWLQELKKDKLIPEGYSITDLFNEDFYGSINEVLNCNDLDSLLKISDQSNSLNLFTFIKDAIYSYNVFVSTNHAKEDFIITDRGWAGYRGPLGVKKINAMLNMLQLRYDPQIDMLVHMSSPQDYAVYPLSSSMALIAMSSAYKIHSPKTHYHIIYPEEAPTLSSSLGFGSIDIIESPEIRYGRDGLKEYRYDIKQLTKKDVSFLNGLLIKKADRYCGFADVDRVRYSMNECGIIF